MQMRQMPEGGVMANESLTALAERIGLFPNRRGPIHCQIIPPRPPRGFDLNLLAVYANGDPFTAGVCPYFVVFRDGSAGYVGYMGFFIPAPGLRRIDR